MRVIIAGSRGFSDYKLLKQKVLEVISPLSNSELIEIVSGTARGADKLGEKFAGEFGLKVTRFPAKWDEFGKSAGYRRNKEMAEYASKDNGKLIAFWDGESRGTYHMIQLAKQAGLDVHVVNNNEHKGV